MYGRLDLGGGPNEFFSPARRKGRPEAEAVVGLRLTFGATSRYWALRSVNGCERKAGARRGHKNKRGQKDHARHGGARRLVLGVGGAADHPLALDFAQARYVRAVKVLGLLAHAAQLVPDETQRAARA